MDDTGFETRPSWEPQSDATPRATDGDTRPPGVEPATWDPLTGRWVRPGEPGPGFTQRIPPATFRRPAAGLPTWALTIGGGLVGAAVAIAVIFGISALRPGGGGTVVERRIEPGLTGTPTDNSTVVGIAQKARPWVVNISAREQAEGIFGTRIAQGTGSGVIIRSDGHILTNAHVVRDADAIEVTLASGDELPAELVGLDEDTDVAVLKVDREGLPSAVVGSAKDLEVGELAVAIGSPLGLQQSVTAGIVSALGRTVERAELGLPPLLDMIQTDAPVTQGNSGGALISHDGALVGINTAIAVGDVGAEGIAFAIPIDIAKGVADELIATGRATHPWIGIIGANIDAETARQFGIGQGALVREVVQGGPADRAGLQPGDIIVGFGEETITSMDELVVEIRQREIGDTVPVDIVREGQTQTVELTIGDRPADL